ncbi:MAG: hypothetical protein ACR2HJ_00355 [Fimbriimonadales bacterium]
MNILSFLRILGGLFAIWIGLLGTVALGGWALLLVILGVLDVITGGFMIYLIGETD